MLIHSPKLKLYKGGSSWPLHTAAHPVYHVENVEASAADRADEDLLKMDHQKKIPKLRRDPFAAEIVCCWEIILSIRGS